MRIVVGNPVTSMDQPKAQWFFGGAIAISLLMHAGFGVALIDGVARQLPETETEETPILVDLVPPPEQETPEQKTEEPPPQPEAQEPPPEPAVQQKPEAPQPVPTMQRVIEYGETDSGPKVDRDGEAALEPNEAKANEPDQSAPKADEADESQAAEAEAAPDEVADAEAKPDGGADTETAPDDPDTAGRVAVLVTPKARPARKRRATREKTGTSGSIARSTRLQSRKILSDPRTLTSMIGVPRPQRVNDLCMTEFAAQLLAERPPRLWRDLPVFHLAKGNVLQPRLAAFSSNGRWFDFKMRCEVDDAATKVVKFSYQIGRPIPRSEWAVRNLPRF